MVPDWHFEWHSVEDQKQIFAGQATMQCPLCKADVGFDGFVLIVAGSKRTPAMRDIEKAARWARNYSGSLIQYLKQEEGRPFNSYWNAAEVQAADLKAAAASE
jgi:hypothetical protein